MMMKFFTDALFLFDKSMNQIQMTLVFMEIEFCLWLSFCFSILLGVHLCIHHVYLQLGLLFSSKECSMR